ncbi:GNAT family N-acetyltransferase [Actinomarinicola tropica]|uniref:GNAT family N-acetyltransferase n=1 Tax=Actinomarinicola tropica TaxID=2789776 RepID=A0A5Q2RHI4_9ACTN|nr:GNAT family protein [Actinomarinicola tropica]QGG93776.1 GNAT family N-acetyltransferase [Actinomarinicola tropica]
MSPVLHGPGVVLRPLTDSDVDELLRILSTPEVSRWWEGYDRSRVLDELVAEGDGGSFGIVAGDAPDGPLVGLIQYYEQDDPDYRHSGVDLFVDPGRHRRGIGRAAISTLVRHLVDDLGHHRVIIDPPVENERAIAVFTSLGFRPVGTLRRYERHADGTWGDNMLLELIADELVPVEG